MTSFRTAATTRVMHWENGKAVNLVYPTNKVLGERDGTGTLYTSNDTVTATRDAANKAAFLNGNNRFAVIHAIYVHDGTAGDTISVRSLDNTANFLPNMDAGAPGVKYEFGPGFIIHGGFAVERSATTIACTVVWSLLEN